ncbi:hypothetical protein C8Q73DRAFT_343837 [Cubamyces lactineus]|nr:hypothetical protein C8Q73DRAFT_343837 [Cubamyces lactineus]
MAARTYTDPHEAARACWCALPGPLARAQRSPPPSLYSVPSHRRNKPCQRSSRSKARNAPWEAHDVSYCRASWNAPYAVSRQRCNIVYATESYGKYGMHTFRPFILGAVYASAVSNPRPQHRPSERGAVVRGR